jgi:hypothetical protein
MKQSLYSRVLTRTSAPVLAAFLILVAAGSPAIAQDPDPAPHPSGATYIITILYAQTGAFSSRGVITLNPDRTLFVLDSAEGGPTYHFGDQQGIWGVTRSGIVGRTINFSYGAQTQIARLDYTFNFGPDGAISGTVALYYFPLTANPFGSGGTSGGTYTFTGSAVPLP